VRVRGEKHRETDSLGDLGRSSWLQCSSPSNNWISWGHDWRLLSKLLSNELKVPKLGLSILECRMGIGSGWNVEDSLNHSRIYWEFFQPSKRTRRNLVCTNLMRRTIDRRNIGTLCQPAQWTFSIFVQVISAFPVFCILIVFSYCLLRYTGTWFVSRYSSAIREKMDPKFPYLGFFLVGRFRQDPGQVWHFVQIRGACDTWCPN
jgi:hypothetical protein